MLIEVQKLVDGKPVPRGRVFIGQYGSDPYLNQSTAVYTDSSYTKPISAIGGIQLDYDGFPIDDNGQRVNLYTPNAYSIQLFTKYGNAIFPTWRDVESISGLDPTADETISGVWDFQKGLAAGGFNYGQTSPALGAPVGIGKSLSFTDNHATLDVGMVATVVGDNLIYNYPFYVSMDPSLLVDDDVVITGLAVDGVGLSTMEISKSSGKLTRRYENTLRDNNDARTVLEKVDDELATFAFEDDSEQVKVPLDGRILTEQVTTSRTLTKADIGKILICTGSSDITITVPVGLQDKSFNCMIKNETASNVVNLVAGAGATVNNKDSAFNIELNGRASIMPTLTTDVYDVFGDLE